MKDEDVFQEHAPNVPLEDGIPNYIRVAYDNIEDGLWYFVTPMPVPNGDVWDYIVYVVMKNEDSLDVMIGYKRHREEPEEVFVWIDNNTEYELSREDIEAGLYRFYTYMPAQEGGGLAEDVRSALSQPVYTLPAGTDFSVSVLPERDRFQTQNVLVQEQAGIPALPLAVRHKSRKSSKRHRSRKVQKSRKRKTRRRH
jgi:hypothetical protein